MFVLPQRGQQLSVDAFWKCDRSVAAYLKVPVTCSIDHLRIEASLLRIGSNHRIKRTVNTLRRPQQAHSANMLWQTHATFCDDLPKPCGLEAKLNQSRRQEYRESRWLVMRGKVFRHLADNMILISPCMVQNLVRRTVKIDAIDIIMFDHGSVCCREFLRGDLLRCLLG